MKIDLDDFPFDELLAEVARDSKYHKRLGLESLLVKDIVSHVYGERRGIHRYTKRRKKIRRSSKDLTFRIETMTDINRILWIYAELGVLKLVKSVIGTGGCCLGGECYMVNIDVFNVEYQLNFNNYGRMVGYLKKNEGGEYEDHLWW